MTREELHELVDIVMDAMERKRPVNIDLKQDYINVLFGISRIRIFSSNYYSTFSDLTQAVKDYIKSLG